MNPQWHIWLKRLHHVTGTMALTAGRELPLREFVTELRAIANEMELTSKEKADAN